MASASCLAPVPRQLRACAIRLRQVLGGPWGLGHGIKSPSSQIPVKGVSCKCLITACSTPLGLVSPPGSLHSLSSTWQAFPPFFTSSFSSFLFQFPWHPLVLLNPFPTSLPEWGWPLCLAGFLRHSPQSLNTAPICLLTVPFTRMGALGGQGLDLSCSLLLPQSLILCLSQRSFNQCALNE